MRDLALVLLALAALAAPAIAQDADLLSKDEARRLFTMSRRQWRDHITGAVTAGVALRVPGEPLTLKSTVPRGPATTRLEYSRGDATPTAVHVVMVVPPLRSSRFTEAVTTAMIAEVRRRMAPEYDVRDSMEHALDGGLTFFFTITARPEP